MNRERFIEPARLEILAEVVYYRRLEVELGARFLEAVQDVTAHALAYPQAGSSDQSGIRHVYLKDCPFALIYRSDEQGTTIYALAHHARRPGYWRNRTDARQGLSIESRFGDCSLAEAFPAFDLGHTRWLYAPAAAFATTTTVDGVTTTHQEAELFDRKGWMGEQSLPLGTRAATTQAPAAYEIPAEVIREAIVNAVAHRDYTSNGSVQVQTIKRLGTGTGGMIRRCREAGLSEPVFALADGFRISLGRPATSVLTQETTQETTEQIKEASRGAGDYGGATCRTTTICQQILAQLRSNPQVTIAKLASLLNPSDRGVEYNLRKLRQDGRIRREGSTKAGQWVVLSPSEG